MLLQLQQQQQWQYEQQFQTYESFGQVMADMPHGPVYASIIIATIPFIVYLLWKKSYLRTFITTPAVTLLSRTWYSWKDRGLENRVNEEYVSIAGKKIHLKDIFRYGLYASMAASWLLIMKKAFFFSMVISESMAPTLMVADLVLVESITTENIEVGDIVVFRPPGQEIGSVVHRVTSVSDDGEIWTKGDNAGPDDWTLTGENIEGKLVIVGGKPLVIKNFGLYLMPRRTYLEGSDPIYEGVRGAIEWIHTRGPIVLLVLLLIILIGSVESRKKYKAIYE
jgi:signal peptidase I